MFTLAAALALQLETPAAASEPEPTERVCLLLATIWSGTTQDVRHIHEIPVPERYRRFYEDDPCQNFGWPMESLVTWHLAFGDEASLQAALTHLDAHFTNGIGAPASLPRRMAAAVRAARPAIRAFSRVRAAGGREEQAARRIYENDRSIVRIRELVVARERLLFLTRQFLRAAEIYGSALNLAEAGRYFSYARDSAAALAGVEGFDADVLDPTTQEASLDMRLAVAAARIGGTPQAIQAAEAELARFATPAVLEAGSNVPAPGQELCDLENGPQRIALQAACEEGDWQTAHSAIAYWTSRADLDFMLDRDDLDRAPQSYEVAIGLLDLQGGSGRIIENRRDREIILRLGRAEQLARAARRLAAGDNPRLWDILSRESDALSELALAERLAPPAQAPAWFRRIATAYLAIAEDIRRREAADGRESRAFVDPRMTAYFRHVLASLDRIAVGD